MRAALASAVVAGLCLVAGCGPDAQTLCAIECMPPAPIATVLVTDARTGLPVPRTAVTGGDAAWTCAEVSGRTECTSIQLTTTGAFDVAVTAPGYQAATVHVGQVVQSDGCCPPRAAYTPATAQLTPA